jgi:hypothetical protein
MLIGIYFIFFTISNAISAHFDAAGEYIKERVKSQDLGTSFNQQRYVLGCTVVSIFLCIFIGAAIFQSLEGWDFITSVYFAMETSTVSLFLSFFLFTFLTCFDS